MRELKFRAWVDEFNYYAFDIQERADMAEWFGHPTIHIEQYTGLKDKNGKEIYEGDIVRVKDYGTYEAFWQSWDSSFNLKPIDVDIEELEYKNLMLCDDWENDYTIIGNIHENKELLEEE